MTATMKRALQILNRSAKSSGDLRDKLLTEDFPEKTVQQSIERLQENGLLNDTEYARSLARRHDNKGNRGIQFRLKQNQLSEDDIQAAIDELEPEIDRARYQLQKKISRIKAKNDYERVRKAAAFLAGRGFSPDTCFKVAKEINSEIEDKF